MQRRSFLMWPPPLTDKIPTVNRPRSGYIESHTNAVIFLPFSLEFTVTVTTCCCTVHWTYPHHLTDFTLLTQLCISICKYCCIFIFCRITTTDHRTCNISVRKSWSTNQSLSLSVLCLVYIKVLYTLCSLQLQSHLPSGSSRGNNHQPAIIHRKKVLPKKVLKQEKISNRTNRLRLQNLQYSSLIRVLHICALSFSIWNSYFVIQAFWRRIVKTQKHDNWPIHVSGIRQILHRR